jgi:hypothetical protein
MVKRCRSTDHPPIRYGGPEGDPLAALAVCPTFRGRTEVQIPRDEKMEREEAKAIPIEVRPAVAGDASRRVWYARCARWAHVRCAG